MADDGMLMNFDIGTEPLHAKTTFKGGRWKDRLAARNNARYQQQNPAGRPRPPPSERQIFDRHTYDETNEEYIGPHSGETRAPKRQRVDNGFKPAASSRSATTAAVVSGKLPAGSISTGRRTDASGFKGKPLQVISSLFTYNPSTKTTFDEPTTDAEPAKPSNAPLSDEFSTFTSLGMSRRLAAHLTTKLEMKAPTAIQKAAIPELIRDESDAFIQAETGSGKTLAYLLPIVERIMAESVAREAVHPDNKDTWIHRDSGLFAIVLAPTRELCKQISVVLEKLLRCAPWIVGTTVIGGESKKSEKARLRKGVNILIATPGRLADHLDNTEVLKVNTVRWLVLDEGDRLMELGFEAEIKSIVQKIGRTRLASNPSNGVANGGLPKRRVTVLCSATMQMNVQKLGEISLKDAVHIKADPLEEDLTKGEGDEKDVADSVFSAPAQLKQEYAIVPAKQRLVTLHALLRYIFARRGTVMKAIVFISCADSVDFHFSLFGRPSTSDTDDENADKEKKKPSPEPSPIGNTKADLTKDTTSPAPTLSTPSNPSIQIYKLHGSLPQNIRTATLKSFTEAKDPSILICTDVASRGLDLPNVDFVIEYDPPFASADHLHRIGRTARAGRAGRSLIFLLPGCEEGYISILSTSSPSLTPHTSDALLRKGFGGAGAQEWEARATDWQLDVERWVLGESSSSSSSSAMPPSKAAKQTQTQALEMARRAYQSHIRAYATHVATEREVFDIKELHLGHLAKAFGLRDRPGAIRVPGLRPGKGQDRKDKVAAIIGNRRRDAKSGDKDLVPVDGERERKERKRVRKERDDNRGDDNGGGGGAGETVATRMRKKMLEHMSSASEFNIG